MLQFHLQMGLEIGGAATATHSSVLPHTATHSSSLTHTAALQPTSAPGSILQHNTEPQHSAALHAALRTTSMQHSASPQHSTSTQHTSAHGFTSPPEPAHTLPEPLVHKPSEALDHTRDEALTRARPRSLARVCVEQVLDLEVLGTLPASHSAQAHMTRTHGSDKSHTHPEALDRTRSEARTDKAVPLDPSSAVTVIIVQHTATHCNALQLTATHCNTLQLTATHCNELHRTARRAAVPLDPYRIAVLAMSVYAPQHTATDCNTLQRTAKHCNTLQNTYTSERPLRYGDKQ